MSHFAKIENGVVTQVIVAEQDFIDSGAVGDSSQWIQTSYNSNIRKRYAGIGYTYDVDLDAFISPKPFDSWILDVESANWIAPVPLPQDEKMYLWSEETLSWKESTHVLPGVK